MSQGWERRALQGAVLLAGLVPVIGGAAGVWLGASLLSDVAGATSLDSQFRYLSGLLLGIGLIFWALVPRIERHTTIFRLLSLLVVVGGLARLLGMLLHGLPPAGMAATLGMELLVTPGALPGAIAHRGENPA